MSDEYKKSVIIGADLTVFSRVTLRHIGCICDLTGGEFIWINPGCPVHGDMLYGYGAASTAAFPASDVRYGIKLPEVKP